MKCPRCESTVLDERERDGVTIDVCPQCRGIWLDRGELERLIARATAEMEAAERRVFHDGGARAPGGQYRDRHDSDHDHDRRGGHGRKRSWLDIFD